MAPYYDPRVVRLMWFDELNHPALITAPVDFQALLTINGVAMLAPGIFSSGLISLCVLSF